MTKFDQKIGRIWIDRELEKNLDQIKSRPNLISDTIMILEDFFGRKLWNSHFWKLKINENSMVIIEYFDLVNRQRWCATPDKDI